MISICTRRAARAAITWKRAVALAAAGRLTGQGLVTHRLPLEDITDGFRMLRERQGDPLKMVFVPPGS